MLQFDGNFILNWRFTVDNDLKDILYSESEKKHIVFIDGYKSVETHEHFMRVCHDWFYQNNEKNRLVVICSMSSRGKTDGEDDKIDNVKEFFVNSWKINEYYHDIQNEEFFNSIEQYLDSSQKEQITEEERSKEEKLKEILKELIRNITLLVVLQDICFHTKQKKFWKN